MIVVGFEPRNPVRAHFYTIEMHDQDRRTNDSRFQINAGVQILANGVDVVETDAEIYDGHIGEWNAQWGWIFYCNDIKSRVKKKFDTADEYKFPL